MSLAGPDPAVDPPSALPRRPLRLQGRFVVAMWRRALTLGLIGIAALSGMAWPLAGFQDAWSAEETWERAASLRVVRVDVDDWPLLGVLHAVHTTVVVVDHGTERVVPADDFRILKGPPLRRTNLARRDPVTGRVLTPIGVAARWERMAMTGAAALVVGCSAFVLLLGAGRRLHGLRVARRVAGQSEEIVLALLEAPHSGHYLFAAPAPDPELGGYRESARKGRVTVLVRLQTDEPGPLFLEPERAHALGLRGPRGEILVVREDAWPFALAPEEVARVRDCIAAWAQGRG